MSKRQPPPPVEPEQDDDATRFDRVVRALFRVDKRDVPKHEPTKRAQASATKR